MKKTEFPLQKYFKVVIYPSEVGWKQMWNDADASWEIICCKAFLRAGEPQPLPRAKAGGWDIAGRRKGRTNQSWYYYRRRRKGEARQLLSHHRKKTRGRTFWCKVIQHLFQACVPKVLFGHKCATSWATQSIFLEPFLLLFSLVRVIILNSVSTKSQDLILIFSITLNIYWTWSRNNSCSPSKIFTFRPCICHMKIETSQHIS